MVGGRGVIVADTLSKAGWRCGYLKYRSRRPKIWVVAAEREDAERFIVHAHDMAAAFLELRATIHRKLRSG